MCKEPDIDTRQYTLPMQEHIASASGVVTAEFHQPFESAEKVSYHPLPQTPSAVEFDCSITMNFPAMLMLADRSEEPPSYTRSSSENKGAVSLEEWSSLPSKSRPPIFSVHRCHHRGMERSEQASELPLGFREAIQRVCNLPPNICLI